MQPAWRGGVGRLFGPSIVYCGWQVVWKMRNELEIFGVLRPIFFGVLRPVFDVLQVPRSSHFPKRTRASSTMTAEVD